DSCQAASDRNLKQDFEGVRPAEVLERLTSVPITTWRYTNESSDVRHMGPMAQDFRAAFGLGPSERRIDMVDSAGVTIAAIQGLHSALKELQKENSALRRE